MILNIVKTPNPVLTTPTKKVDKIDSKIKDLVHDMEETLVAQKDPEGVGLAATQVGIGLSLFIIKPTKKGPTEVFINPKIIELVTCNVKPHSAEASRGKHDKEERMKLEGCLSIPKIWSPLKRQADKVLLRYQDINDNTKEEWFTGFKAIIIQHEVDHLNGVLFTQRSLEANTPLYEEKDGELIKLKY